jgi:hypothetical protein
MNTRQKTIQLAIPVAIATGFLPAIAGAATIDSWNLLNVVEGPEVTGTDTGASVVYDRVLPDASATTNGQIVYTAPEADTPGMKVSNVTFTQSGDTYTGCILATSGTACDGPFQSGKRFKVQATDTGAVDLVFNVNETETDSVYRVFQRLINVTGEALGGFKIELGTGIGGDFTASTDNDGLSFSSTVSMGPDGASSFSQFPFGLFGSLTQPNPNPLQLPGFFDTTSRAGYNVVQSLDSIVSTGFYGNYGTLFGNWLSQEDVPLGLLWDYASGAADPLVMAWDNGSQWEVRRGINNSLDGDDTKITAEDVYALAEGQWKYYDYGDIAGVETFLAGIDLFDDAIEDLANLNLNFAINLGSNFSGSTFTLRTTSIAPIPLPAGLPLLLTGFAALAGLRYRRKQTMMA